MGFYTLKITDLTNNKTYTLSFPGTKTITDVKLNVNSISRINSRHQQWTGWPPNIDDSTILALSGINYPEHELTLERNNKDSTDLTQNIVNIESDDEEFEDASETFGMDDYFVDNVTTKRIEPLSKKIIS